MLWRHGRRLLHSLALAIAITAVASCGGDRVADRATTEAGSVSSADADPAAWVLNACYIENGYVPPFRDERRSPSDYSVGFEAQVACRDFLPPVRLSESEQRVHDCLRSIGIDYDLRLPTDRRLTEDEARRVIACAPPTTGSSEFMGCMIELGAGLPLKLDDDAMRTASASCGHLVPPRVASAPLTPPTPYATLIDCLAKNGYEPAVGTPSRGPTPLPEFHAAVDACRAHLPDSSLAGPAYARYVTCHIQQGILPYPYFNFDASNRDAAARACAGIIAPPRAAVPDSTQKYLDCVRENGVVIDAGASPSDPLAEIPRELAARAARACREIDPVRSNVSRENRPFYDCLADNGLLSIVVTSRPSGSAVRRGAEAACSAHYPFSPVSDDLRDYAKCLRRGGIVPRLGERPDLDLARRVFASCEPSYPKRS